ncbi:MAG: thiamine pyrophosphate-binding protein [Lapillicoccus sp.]
MGGRTGLRVHPGDGINRLLGGCQRADDQPRFIQARHHEMAAFEACGYAKLSGRVGVCTATSGAAQSTC